MTDSMFVMQGLLLSDLEEIHRWLIDDFVTISRIGHGQSIMLHHFMTLVRDRYSCWGLFREDDICIGFALCEEGKDCLELKLFAIAPKYRGERLGVRFALTVIAAMKQDKPIRVNPLDNSEYFWRLVGFEVMNWNSPDRIMELREKVPFDPIPS